MIKAFVVDNDRLRLTDDLLADGDRVVWADLFNPTKEEEATIETWLGVAIPTREEMEEIEISSRLYVEDGAYFKGSIDIVKPEPAKVSMPRPQQGAPAQAPAHTPAAAAAPEIKR